MKEEDVLEIPIAFEDKNIDYALYIKYGSFSGSIEPKDDSTCLNTTDVYYGTYGRQEIS